MFDKYNTTGLFDEMMDENGNCRPHYQAFKKTIEVLGKKKMQQLQHSTDKAQMSMGMTFNVYHDNQGLEKILHLDLVFVHHRDGPPYPARAPDDARPKISPFAPS